MPWTVPRWPHPAVPDSRAGMPASSGSSEPAKAGNTDTWIHWSERIETAGRGLSSTDPAAVTEAAQTVLAEHRSAAIAEYGPESDGAAATEDEVLESLAIDWVREHLIADGIGEGDYPQQAGAFLGRELARLLRAWGSPLEQAQVALTAAALLRAAKAAVTEAAAK